MIDLIERMEKAAEPDRRLDIQISGIAWDKKNPKWGADIPRFTSSIDAALILLPKHYLWQVKRGIECIAIVWFLEHDWDEGAPTGITTAYPALALCIAWAKCHAIEHHIDAISRPQRADEGKG